MALHWIDCPRCDEEIEVRIAYFGHGDEEVATMEIETKTCDCYLTQSDLAWMLNDLTFPLGEIDM